MIENLKEPCRRCLLKEIDEKDVIEQVQRAINRIKPHEKTEDEVYGKRLAICCECDHLIDGTCMKCGCYVELRAAFKNNRCPLAGSKKKW